MVALFWHVSVRVRRICFCLSSSPRLQRIKRSLWFDHVNSFYNVDFKCFLLRCSDRKGRFTFHLYLHAALFCIWWPVTAALIPVKSVKMKFRVWISGIDTGALYKHQSVFSEGLVTNNKHQLLILFVYYPGTLSQVECPSSVRQFVFWNHKHVTEMWKATYIIWSFM